MSMEKRGACLGRDGAASFPHHPALFSARGRINQPARLWLFSGGIELRFEHIVNLAGAMGLRVDEILRFVYPETGEPPSEAARRVLAATGHFQPPVPQPAVAPPAPSAPSEADLERLMARTLRRFFAEMAKIEE